MVFDNHAHTEYSNFRLLDCINHPKELIDRAIELGLDGIAITDHEILSAHEEVNEYALELAKTNPNFKIALGNEIYLVNDRTPKQKYFHFILIAKNATGHRALRELSSTAWFYSYKYGNIERVPTLKSELEYIVKKFPNSLIATTACIGGELSKSLLAWNETGDKDYLNHATDFVNFCINLFGDDFYIECAPGCSQEQIKVNKMLYSIAKNLNVKMSIGSDAHYLKKEDRWTHKAYLNSKDGEREIDTFYEYTYLMSPDELRENLRKSYNDEIIDWIFNCSLTIKNKIENYSLFNKQDIPRVKVKDYPIPDSSVGLENYPILNKMQFSNDIQDRYWVNQCLEKLDELNKYNDKYLTELEEEARIKTIIGQKLETNMFRYPNTLQHYIDMIWECGSMVGAGRGSSCAALNHYLMGITQLDPIEWNLPFFRYMNEERVELGDIDIDLCPSKRPFILQKIKEERRDMLNNDIPQWAKDNLGCTLVATYGTEGTKSAILSACRGYRSKDYPNGIEVDEAQFLSSLIPVERGFLWDIKDVVEGNPDKGRRPVAQFINTVSQYPGLLEIIKSISGTVNHRGSHASGVILFDGDPFERTAFMRTPSGDITTQFDLHSAEKMGLTKYDFLVTDIQDKLVKTIDFLQRDGYIEKELSLREVYNKYFHPNVLPLDDKRIWDALRDGTVINTFQFDSDVGKQAAKKISPNNILEMSDANGLMRLMGDGDKERPLDKYVRFKNNIQLWYDEMNNFGLTKEEQKILEPHFKSSYGVPPSQEQLMRMLMDENICGFTLAEANNARKIVGKKLISKVPALKEKVLSQAKSEALGNYVWENGIGPQMSYSFSIIHALAYSFIGVQSLYIATNWNPIYWNTACLIVNSGSLEDNSETEIVDIYEPELEEMENGTVYIDLPDRSGKIKKTASTDYGKMAKAMGEIIAAGIEIGLIDINHSNFGFEPDAANNKILYGLKAVLNVGDDIIENTIALRPYRSPKEYLLKVKPNKQAMISLIKAGAFDSMMDRKDCLIWYVWETCKKKKELNLRNANNLIQYNLLDESNSEIKMARRFYEFNRYLKAVCISNNEGYYKLDERAIAFLQETNYDNLILDNFHMSSKAWDRNYQKEMDVLRNWISTNKPQLLQKINQKIFFEDWQKYAGKNNLSAWEMETLCFYYHEHELQHIDNSYYGYKNFSQLSETPIVEKTYTKGNRKINLFKLERICGTCIAKNKSKGTVTLLTTSGVVNVKFRKEYFAVFDKQISQKQSDGKKKVIEKSWFNRGSMIVVMGVRIGDDFLVKKYANSIGEQIYKIDNIKPDGKLTLRHNRRGEDVT